MKVLTVYPVAVDSQDHIFPWGTARDNTTDHGFIMEVEAYFQYKKIKTLDIGCSGGQLTIDFNSRGHDAIGIEGSDYSIRTGRANWPAYHNKKLFTADATKPYQVTDDDGNNILFDLITSWEVIEHIHMDDMDAFWGNITKHMHEDSIFCGSISTVPDVIDGHVLHQSVFPQEVWYTKILNKYFSTIQAMPFHNKVRYGDTFHVLLKL